MNGYHTYKSVIEDCLKCAAICNHCASACAQDDDAKSMAKCIQLDMQCATICYAAAQLMSLGSEKSKEICLLCAQICEACGNECARHQMKHCQECAEVCRQCTETCREM